MNANGHTRCQPWAGRDYQIAINAIERESHHECR